ncbi:MAG: chromosome segregation protein SMC [Candidatus Aminicenantes bacterium]|nr:chromosome segregation protein SMC [Candidatus Aminicenantes bacterium]
MYIKRLELQGFKTFPERTKVLFNPGITIIIGPNGTGKSNIVEAIQWVLGGHRQKTVRGERTEDAIFNGTQKRPAMGMADVSLVFQNTEEELQINHRAFRTGESEYRLNGKMVRLRDIQEELWKKAISENKYYVIEQGAIGTFVTSKPVEKRALIEEAAGTAYYKDKKRLAEHKLDDTEQNLTRLEDILAEVAKARNSLARQAGAAERYRKLRERIRELTVLHFKHRGEQLQAGQREVQTQYDLGLEKERAQDVRLAEEERTVNHKRGEARDLEQTLKTGQDRLYSLKAQIARAEAERDREKRRAEDLEVLRRRAAAESDELLAELMVLEQELNLAGEDAAAQAEDLTRKEAEAVSLESSHREAEARVAPWAAKVESLRADTIQVLAELTSARNEQAKLEKEIELIYRQEEKLRSRRDEATERHSRKAAEREAVETERASGAAGLAERERSEAEARARLTESVAGINALRDRIGILKDERDATVHHLGSLRKLEAKERQAAAVPDVPSALGAFADMVSSDAADAPLIDVFWKEEARSLVIRPQDVLDALGAGELRGNFLLLPPDKGAAAGEIPLFDPEILGRLKARLKPGAALGGRLPLLQDAFIVKDIQSAVRLWLAHPDRNFITPQGDVLLRGGLLKLGQRQEGLFTFIQEIRDVEGRLAAQDAVIEPLVRELEAAMAGKAELDARLDALASEMAVLRRTLIDLEKRTALVLAERDKLENDLALFGHDLEILAMDRHGFLEKQERHAVVLRTLEDAEKLRRETAEAEERELLQHQERANLETQALLELRGAIDLRREKIGGLEARVKAQETRKAAAAAKLGSLQEEIRASEAEQESLRRMIVELGDRAVNLDGQRAEQEEALAESEGKLADLRRELLAAESGLSGLREEHERLKDERMSWEVRKAEVDRDLVNLEEACWQELKKTIQEVKAEAAAESAETGDVEAELDEAKDKLQRIGAVNLMAEEEYQQQKERHEFLVQQRADLRESISQTKEAIKQIDEESRTRFLTALAEVNTYFQELFTTLFKGGTASVRLLDENDPLESGVDVLAQPPGKRVGNMGLLSGGEKSLTSLAFLFALFRYKPTPFCILDEVDAALDEANLIRFLDLMKTIKSDTQFIIITHNYRTMEVADYIYGTTMEEPNVTRVFSMKMEKKAEAEPVA